MGNLFDADTIKRVQAQNAAKIEEAVDRVDHPTPEFVVFAARVKTWADWHFKNYAIWEHFEKFALQAIKLGKKSISHWLLINRVRWEVVVATNGSDFKISNDHIAFYARYWNAKYPQHRGLFSLKKIEGEPEDPSEFLRIMEKEEKSYG